ncbi:MAG TPA: helix-turn-helix domain-containing protein [Streptosporangiaceae bacterium]|nr:helix-turn-helix domain-containing protein [Streptosporangiaceae bacterium]
MMALTVPSRHAKPANAVTTRPSSTGAHAAVEAPGQKALYRVPEAMRLLSLSRSMIYQQIRLGRLRSVKEGNARLIPVEAIADYVALLEAEAEARQ